MHIQFLCVYVREQKNDSNLINGNFHNEQVRPKNQNHERDHNNISARARARGKNTFVSTNQNLNVQINLAGRGGEVFFSLTAGIEHRGEMKPLASGVGMM